MKLNTIKGFESTSCARRAFAAIAARVEAAQVFAVEEPALSVQPAAVSLKTSSTSALHI